MPPPVAAFPCCRSHDLFAPVEEFAQALMRCPGDEAYWFNWNSSFDGKATIRVARLGGDLMVFRVHRSSHFGKVRRYWGWLASGDWERLEDAVVTANFWTLDEHDRPRGLDGSMWSFAGRRGCEYHYISRWSPERPLWNLGRCLFDLAGLAKIRLS
jgi:hypothetical protein